MPRHPNSAVTIVAALARLNWLHDRAMRWTLRRNLDRLWAGDPEPLLATYADDIRFTFPGRSSWAGEFRGKAEVARWLRRFVRVGLRFEVHEILVVGPPWAATLCLWFTDRLTDAGGNRGLREPERDHGQALLGQDHLLRGHAEGRRAMRTWRRMGYALLRSGSAGNGRLGSFPRLLVRQSRAA